MKLKINNTYFWLLLAHVAIGVLIYMVQALAKVYFVGALLFFLYLIIKSRNKNNEALFAAAYFTGAEVFFRMTQAVPVYEAGKYSVISFILIGLFISGTSRRSGPYWLFLFLLLPGIWVAALANGMDANFRNAIFFNLSGPFCLAITGLYCTDRKITYNKLKLLTWSLLMPLTANAVYLGLYTPNLRAVLTGTGANYAASGGFGPNQVATVMGLGLFVAFVQVFINSKQKLFLIVNFLLVAYFGYRGIVTFSRGGVWTAIVMVMLFIYVYFLHGNMKAKKKSSVYIVVFLIVGVLTWFFSSFQTNGFIDKRYTNRDGAGRVKKDVTTGRLDLLTDELTAFIENPVKGVGVGQVKYYRLQKTGNESASHNEVSRMLSEHGILGVMMLGILLVYPLVIRTSNFSNYLFYAALAFWFLTISHSSMRIAAPAFIYALSLLNVIPDRQKDTLHR